MSLDELRRFEKISINRYKTKDEEVEEFFRHFEYCMRGASDAMKLRKLMELLEADVEAHVIGQTVRVQNDYGLMKKALMDRYHVVLRDTEVHLRFSNLRQNDNKLISDFMSRWEKERTCWLNTCKSANDFTIEQAKLDFVAKI